LKTIKIVYYLVKDTEASFYTFLLYSAWADTFLSLLLWWQSAKPPPKATVQAQTQEMTCMEVSAQGKKKTTKNNKWPPLWQLVTCF